LDSKVGVFEDRSELLAYYAQQAEDFRMRHTAIWTEVQHYTWVLSVLLGIGPLSMTSDKSMGPAEYSLFLSVSVIGLFVAIVASLIIRRDFVYFSRADARLLYIEKSLGVLHEAKYLDARLARASSDDFNVPDDATKQGRSSVFSLRIRQLILLLFSVYACAALGQCAIFTFLLFDV
jgi:hypothetical protein